jgi:hypothetical protein
MSQYNPASSNTLSDPIPRPPRKAPPLPPRRPLSDFYGQNASPSATTIAQNQNRYSQGSPTGGTILLNDTEMKVLGRLSLINILLSNKDTAIHISQRRVFLRQDMFNKARTMRTVKNHTPIHVPTVQGLPLNIHHIHRLPLLIRKHPVSRMETKDPLQAIINPHMDNQPHQT